MGDVDWVEGEPFAAPESGGEPPVMAGLVIGRGYAHQSIATLGAADTVAFLLRRELSRPLETASGTVQVEARSSVGLLETTLSALGTRAAVTSALQRLVEILHDPGLLEIPRELPAGDEHPWAGWNKELGAWFGVGPASLSAQINPAWTGDPAALRQEIAAAGPARAPVVGFVSDPELIRPLPAGGGSDLTVPLRWRDVGGHAVGATFENNLLTARAGLGAAGMTAIDLLAGTLHRSVITMTGAAKDLAVTAYPVGDSRLLTVRALTTPATYDHRRARSAVGEALAAYPALSEEALAARLDSIRSQAQRPPAVANLALTRLLTGERTDDAVRAAEVDALTAEAVREAVERLADNLLVGQAGTEEDPAYPLLVPAPVPDPGGDAVTTRTRVPILDERRGDTHLEISATPTRVVSTTKPLTWVNAVFPDFPRRRGEPLPKQTEPVAPSTLDLTRLVGRFDQGETYSSLIDEDGRVVGIPWNALRRPGPLREIVDGATSPEQRRALPPHPEADLLVTRRIRNRRISVALFTVVLLFFASMFFWPDSRGPQQEPTVATVPLGEQVTLGNGSTVTVSDARWETAEAYPHQTVLAEVEFCGGGETVQRGSDAQDRNVVGESHFDIGGTDAATRRGMRPGGTYLAATELEEGQCTSGLVSIEVEVDAPTQEATVQYTNQTGDDVQWEL
ncbi:hypothetical protein SGUI_1569 [Serinicoccus hydrothermalis]|uniref:Uncharacterized protein n=1 Tax=Serinicoccus hydrothermalis TaxID=1758689 RepID=A0A1B1NC64_9MICO|nr:hypothetical protein SGUI_1569 [Serinicoccus hydrothermalis]